VSSPDASDVIKIVDKIAPLLANQHPAIQGAVLADLLATWVTGHPPGVRAELLAMHEKMVRELTVVNARIMGVGP
jgi:hypothetical protein